MGWKDNRRRKRTWYLHYKQLAEGLMRIMDRDGGTEFAPEAILELVYRMYEARRLHGKRFIAESAYESMLLACADAGLTNRSLQPRNYQRRPPMRATPPPPVADVARTNPVFGPSLAEAVMRRGLATFVGEMPVRTDVEVRPAPNPTPEVPF